MSSNASKVSFFSLGEPGGPVPPEGYAYRCEDVSILKPIFYKLLVTPLANRMTARTAPNDVTFLSQLCALVPVAFGLWVAERAVPGWAYAVIPVLGFFGYVVLDHLDGTHARKTGQSSPLGELVDHWCDAWNGAFVPFAWSLCWGGIHYPVVTTILAILGALAYTSAIAEQRVTGVLKLDRMGGNEGMILMCGTLASLAVFGRERVLEAPLGHGYTVQHLFQFLCGLGCVGTVKNVIVRSGARWLPEAIPLLAGSGLVLLWVKLGLDVRLAGFMLAAIGAIVNGRIVLERTAGLAHRWDGLGLGALVLGIGAAALQPSAQTNLWAGSVVLAVLMARAFADFAWGGAVFARWIRRRETLSLFFEPRAEEAPLPEETRPGV